MVDPTRPVGRPRTFDRNATVEIAMRLYWEQGADSISINQICKQSNVSKPGLYREFGGEDGLMTAALARYNQIALSPLHDILSSDIPFAQSLDQLVEYAIMDREPQGLPKGCMLAPMFNLRGSIGPETQNLVDALRDQTFELYLQWLSRAKKNGETSSGLSVKHTALFVSSQISNAMMLQKQGIDKSDIKGMLLVGFAQFVDD